jgi:hypothetical protein
MANNEPPVHPDSLPSGLQYDTVAATGGEHPSSRRALLKSVVAAGALLPLAGKLSAQQECATEFGLQLDDQTMEIAAGLIDRVATDEGFRQAVRAQPVETLEGMGIVLSPEMREVFDVYLKGNPDVLTDAMLGREFVNKAEAVAIVPLVAVGIRVATRPATVPLVRVATYVAVNVRTMAREVPAENYAEAMYRSALPPAEE